ncbi:SH3 domain-containing protein [Leptolyngbya sp. FACHB-36]|uniref:SH3 domain-containing protein n=1 Tax=Leptolyngbya sp. FACHB-36 TaxID=2692808 RepID=UPI001681B8B7|nr:SH3 domain-containing protein [Leptolyngbya sp. FACHB-36]MBD2019903.1 SH3 domain-containing protein [Leptolyngbya sp. FACHB-36]
MVKHSILSVLTAAAVSFGLALSAVAQPAELVGRSRDGIPVYVEPTTDAHSHYSGRAGEAVEVLRAIEGEDRGSTWYNVVFRSGVRGWVPASALQFATGPRPTPDSTISQFETNTYSVRVFRQEGRTRMNVFNKANNQLVLNRVPVRPIREVGSQDRYSGITGDFIYTATIARGDDCLLQIEYAGDTIAQETGSCR